MPYKDYSERVEKYQLAVIPDNVRAKFNALLPFMIKGQQKQQVILTSIEKDVRSILDDEGIVGNFRIAYLNFARALIRAKGHNSGTALLTTATAEKSKFVALGCKSDVLDKIMQVVLTYPSY
jgi:hypothetical protein